MKYIEFKGTIYKKIILLIYGGKFSYQKLSGRTQIALDYFI